MPPGQTFPNPGTCQAGTLDSNHSESWIAVQPGTENLVGSSKFFFAKYSKFAVVRIGAGHWRRIPLGKLRNDQYVPLHPELTELLAANLEHIRHCKRLVADHRAR